MPPLFPGSVGVVLCLDNDDAIELITLEVNPPPILYTLLADLASKLSLWYADTYVFGVISIGDFKFAANGPAAKASTSTSDLATKTASNSSSV